MAIRDTDPIAADTTAETLRFSNRKQFIHPPAQLDGNPLLLALEGGYYAETSVRARRLLARMEAVFAQLFDKPDANEMDGYIFRALTCGGKRLRPLLVCIASEIRAGRAADEDLVVRLMAVVELMHCASLVHDDIVDRSPLRRSRATINAEKGDGYAALCGFRMIGAALELLREAEEPEIAELIARIPLEMSRGELRQLKVEFDLDAQTEADYIERVTRKTAVLIEGSLQLGAIAGGAAPGPRAALSDYGLALGVLFQLRDDLLDFAPSPSDGKPVSQDMERGIYSLPLLFALGALPENEPEGAKLRALLRKTIKSPSELRGLVLTAQRSGGVDYTIERLRAYAGTAEDAVLRLHQTACTEALLLITETLSTECAAAKKPLLAVVKRTNP
ncbi:MAG: polyprenyl synthetase family protein [Clostridiales bacterium]|nr:polyprenyl synthetase family protein [Clostridiales bacterium]